MLGDLCVHSARVCSCTRMADAAREEGRQQGRAEYAELDAAARAWGEPMCLLTAMGAVMTPQSARLLAAVDALPAQTKEANGGE